MFITANEPAWLELGGGVRRQLVSYDDRVMMVKVAFETGASGAEHNHMHTQVTQVLSGSFEVIIAGEMQVLKTGDAFYVPPFALHSCVCLEAGTLLDVFSPVREDFL